MAHVTFFTEPGRGTGFVIPTGPTEPYDEMVADLTSRFRNGDVFEAKDSGGKVTLIQMAGLHALTISPDNTPVHI
jgi:hypothetical protein